MLGILKRSNANIETLAVYTTVISPLLEYPLSGMGL